MKVIINQFKNNYKNDLIRLMIYDLKSDKWFIAFILSYMIIFTVNLLNKNKVISLKPEMFEMLSFTLGFGLLAMLIYTVFHILKTVKRINNEASILYEGKLNIIIDDIYIAVQTESNREYYKKTWDQIKELLVINKTAYFIPINKNEFMMKINKDEIVEGNFEELLELIESKWKN